MKKLNVKSAFPVLFVAVLLTAFGGGRFAVAQDGSALEIDEIPISCQVELITPDGTVELVQVSGQLTLHVYFEDPNEGDADDDDGDGQDEVSTEIVSMDLRGTSPLLGAVRVQVSSYMRSLGEIEEQVNNTPGVLDLSPFIPPSITPTGTPGGAMADSFFDVFFQIELSGLGQIFLTLEPKRLSGVITHKPPAPCDSYENHVLTPIFDTAGNATGFFLGTMRLERVCEDECDWNPKDPHKMHWPQLPDLSSAGMDVDMSLLFLADDFKCMATGPIKDVHIWGSFRDDVLPPDGPNNLTFEITIYSDIPATENSWSMPGELLWSRTFSPDEYSVRKLDDSPEGWYDPTKELYLPDNHRQAYQYNFCIEEGPFIQERGTIYWLSVKEVAPANANYKFGWKTTTHRLRWNDDAVFFLAGKLVSFPLKYPKEHEYMGESLDLAFVITDGEEGDRKHDLGDAPDSSNSFPGAMMLAYPAPGVVANYPTVYEIGSPPYGPIHWQPRAMFHLGRNVTHETEADFGYDEDIKNNLVPRADLSDLDGGDDGVLLTLVLPPCQQTMFNYTVTVLAPDLSMAIVNVWCDWNRDGDWDDVEVCPDGTTVPEWAVQNQQLLFTGPGMFTISTLPFMCWHPQTDAELDLMWMRITIAERPWGDVAGGVMHGGAGPAGGYEYGETEDYLIYPRREDEPLEYDWGDAPTGTVAAGYPTLAFNNGANHVIAGPWLGDENDKPDSEPDGQPDTNALGDDNDGNDDENGVSIPTLIPGQTSNITIEVSGGGGIVQAWIDFNGDMTWQAFEKIYDGFLPTGIHTVSIFVPDYTMVGQTFARFRISKRGGLSPEGPAPDGEVEDHEVFVESHPQITTRPVSATQCPVVQTQCPTVATQCPPVNTRCPVVATQCPAVQTQCVAVTMCPPVNTTCPAVPTTCPAVQTQCPAVTTQCPTVPTQCPITATHMTQCPAVETRCPPEETKCPAVDTECPPEPTQCPVEKTICPESSTNCPVVQTQCPAVETECSLVPTTCQGVITQCPVVETQCPPVPTRCPAVETSCPPEPTKCPVEETKCPESSTSCPVVQTQCPAGDTYCPIYETRCPPEPTMCPPLPTQCPAVETECPLSETRCPPLETECPPLETRCPPERTMCPVMQTQCPAVETECPASETKCPVMQTQCPAVDTQCPPVETRCPPEPTMCPPLPTQCPVEQTICPESSTKCPMLQTTCPSRVTECPAYETRCPSVPTSCPPQPTQCPPVPTECPAVPTQCEPTRCPSVPTQCPPLNTECPAVPTTCEPTQCPRVPTQCPSVPTSCPPQPTQCPSVPTSCPPQPTQCPSVPTSCPPQPTQCPPVPTECPAVPTQCEPTRCPSVPTQCPPLNTECPVEPSPTRCPVVPTQCPPVDTECPVEPSPTRCPVVQTQCPSVDTECPVEPSPTHCPVVQTQCPASKTVCPPVQTNCPEKETTCPAHPTVCPVDPSPTFCPVEPTWCPPVETECPFDPTQPCQVTIFPQEPTFCPAEPTQCPDMQPTICPEPTQCPDELTKCPPIPTQCEPEPTTQCPIPGTPCSEPGNHSALNQNPKVGTRYSPVNMVECPAIDVQAPTVITKDLLAKAR